MPSENLTKFCSVCHKEKNITEFYKAKDGTHNRRGECRACTRIGYKISYDRLKKENPNILRDIHLLKTYGITSKEINTLVKEYNGCMICGRKDPGVKEKNWHVDHDKKTKTIRGVLCMGCNTGLGAFNESPEVLRAAITYLTEKKLAIPMKPKKVTRRLKKIQNYDLRDIIKEKGTEWFENEIKNIRAWKPKNAL